MEGRGRRGRSEMGLDRLQVDGEEEDEGGGMRRGREKGRGTVGGKRSCCSCSPVAAGVRRGAAVAKCILTLDGYSYVIVASPPDTSHTKDDSAAVIRSGTPAAENGQLPPGATSQGSFTILRRTGTRKGRGEMTNTSTTPSPPPSMAQQQPPLPPRVPPQHLPPRVSMREGVAEEEEEDDERAASLLRAEELPSIDSPEACDKAAIQLRCLLKQVRRGQVSADLLQENLQYAARVLEAVFADEAKREEGAGGGGGGRAGEPPSEGRPSTPGESGAAVGAAEEEGAAARRTAARAACPTRLSPHPSPPPPPRRPPPPPPMAPQVQQHQQPQHRMQKRQLRTPVWARRLADEEDELSEVQPDAVPPEVRAWLATTFTRQLGGGGAGRGRRRWGSDEDSKPRFRSVAHAIRAGIFVDRMYRRVLAAGGPLSMQFPPGVVRVLKTLDEWSFDVFALSEAANSQPVKYLGYDLLNRYGMIHKFKVPPSTLEAFLNKIEEGYCRYGNPYHNNIHAADVAQTVHYMLSQTGLMNWLTDLEIFATLVAALVHDFEHTGTTNNFHVMSGSETALLYNDRAVLENHHISASFRTLREEECNILQNLSREDFREFRGLVIDMVLATDMSFHFQQIKNMRNLLTLGESSVDKSKAVSLVLHCCDISHPAKRWDLHRRWTALLLEEFFLQGDKERELGLPFSPLCDRNNTLVAESQIGFIEFIVEPSMAVCSDMLETILAPLNSEATKEVAEENVGEKLEGVKTEEVAEEKPSVIQESKENSKKSSTEEDDATKLQLAQSSGSNGATTTSNQVQASTFTLKKPWVASLMENKKRWKEQAVVDAELRQKQQEEAAAKQLEEGIAEGDQSSSEVCDSNASKEDMKTRTTTE